MDPEIIFHGDFDVKAKPALSAADWYLGLACSHCRRLFAVFDEPTQTGVVKVGGSGTIRVSCPNCGNAAAYPASDLQVFQAPSSRATVINQDALPPSGEANG